MNRHLRLCLSAILGIALAIGSSGCRTKRSKEGPVVEPPSRPKSSEIGPSWEQNVRIRSALDQGDAPKAERLARAVVDRQPANGEAHFLLGKSLMAQKKIDAARPYLEKASVLQTENSLYRRTLAENYDLSAQKALQSNDPKTAIGFWKRCQNFKFQPTQTEKKLTDAFRKLCDQLQAKNDDVQAETTCQEAIALMPTNPAPRLDLANIMLKADRLIEAERVLKELVESNPSFEPGQVAYARILNRMGDTRGARDKVAKILIAFPRSPDAHALKSELENEVPVDADLEADPEMVQKLTILESTSNFKGQAEILQEYLIANPNAAWATLRLGMVLERAGDVPGALAAVNQYLQGHPEDPRAQFFKARCLQLSGDLEGALAILKILDSENKANIQVYDELGQVYAKMGRFDEAKNNWNKALSIDTEYPGVLFNFGQLAMEQKNIAEARSFFDRAIQKDPFNLKYRYFAGLNLKQGGLDQEARQIWESAKPNLNPGDPYGARILRGLGEPVPSAPSISNLTAPPPSLQPITEPPIPGTAFTQPTPAVIQPGAIPGETASESVSNYLTALDAARAGRFDEAIAGFQVVIQKEPNNFNALINLGKVYTSGENHAQASLQYLRALQVSPDNQYAIKALIKSYTNLGLHRQAAELTAHALQLFPALSSEFPDFKPKAARPRSDPRAYEPLVRLLLQDHKPEEAQKIILAGVEENPDNAKLVILHGEVLYCLNELDRAESVLQRAITMDNANPQPYLKLGDLYAARQQSEKAFAQYQLAQNAKFLDPDAAFEIVDRLSAIGKKTEANLLLSRLKGMNLSAPQLDKLRDRMATP